MAIGVKRRRRVGISLKGCWLEGYDTTKGPHLRSFLPISPSNPLLLLLGEGTFGEGRLNASKDEGNEGVACEEDEAVGA
jgi:hypothetical protein